ncbi:MAG: hypothetical protein SGBAC_010571 [Bacillariaceae sp.]
MKFFKKLRGEKPAIAVVVDVLHVGTVQKTFAEDDAEQIKAANLLFIDAVFVEPDGTEEYTQSAYILDESLRDANHPRAIRRRQRQREGDAGGSIPYQMDDDSVGETSFPEIEVPPDMDHNDPVLLEAILAQRQWERQQRRSQMFDIQNAEEESEDYDFDSEYSSEEEGDRNEDDDDRSYDDDDDSYGDEDSASSSVSFVETDDDASRSVSVYNDDEDDDSSHSISSVVDDDQDDDDASRSVSVVDDEEEDGDYSTQDEREALSVSASDDENHMDPAGDSDSGPEDLSQRGENDDDCDDDDDTYRDEAPIEDFDDEFSESGRPIDVGVLEEKSSEDDRHVPNNDDQDARDYSAHAERYHEGNDRYDSNEDSAHYSHHDRNRYSDNDSRSYRDDFSQDDKSYESYDNSVEVTKRRAVEDDNDEDDGYSRGESHYSDDDDDRSAYSRPAALDDQSIDTRRSSCVSESEKADPDGSYRSGSRHYDYTDDACLQQREEEEAQELETLEEARRNLAAGETMHPFLLEHYMALKERKQARRRLSQQISIAN